MGSLDVPYRKGKKVNQAERSLCKGPLDIFPKKQPEKNKMKLREAVAKAPKNGPGDIFPQKKNKISIFGPCRSRTCDLRVISTTL